MAIIEKAMEREIDARYSSTLDLAEDLRSYLEGRVVAAYETGALAEAKKWVCDATNRSRSRWPLRCWRPSPAYSHSGGRPSARIVTRSRRSAMPKKPRANAARAEQVTELVQAALVSSDPNQGGSQEYRVVQAMEAAVRELESGALGGDPQTEAALQTTISAILRGNGRAEEGLRLAQLSLTTRREIFPENHPDVSASLTEMANCLSDLGRSAEALRLHREALEMDRRRVPGDDPGVASDLNNVAACLQELGHATEALVHYEEALAMRRRLFEGDHPDLATSLGNLGSVLSALGRLDEALPQYEAARDMRARMFSGDHPRHRGQLEQRGLLPGDARSQLGSLAGVPRGARHAPAHLPRRSPARGDQPRQPGLLPEIARTCRTGPGVGRQSVGRCGSSGCIREIIPIWRWASPTWRPACTL